MHPMHVLQNGLPRPSLAALQPPTVGAQGEHFSKAHSATPTHFILLLHRGINPMMFQGDQHPPGRGLKCPLFFLSLPLLVIETDDLL